MKSIAVVCVGVWSLFSGSALSQSTPVDRTTTSGGKTLHFRIVEGRTDDVILFESGGGNDASIWNELLAPIAEYTGATLITYDRPGLGVSEVDPRHHGLESDVDRLEAGLAQLGYVGPYTLVGHSLGGFYATLFAARHPGKVRAAVMIDINLACFFTDVFLPGMRNSAEEMRRFKTENPGRYFLALDFEPMVLKMRSVKFPRTIPVIDLVAEQRNFPASTDFERWRNCHAEFAAESSNRVLHTVSGAGHYIFMSNPHLVVAAVLEAHAIANGFSRPELAYAVNALNEQRHGDRRFARSEDALTSWGYELLSGGKKTEAVRMFELNASIYPDSANAHDSLGDGYAAQGDTKAAIRSYTRAMTLNPGSKRTAEKLAALKSGKDSQ